MNFVAWDCTLSLSVEITWTTKKFQETKLHNVIIFMDFPIKGFAVNYNVVVVVVIVVVANSDGNSKTVFNELLLFSN